MSGPILKTKQKRLVAIVDRWCQVHGETLANLNVVSEWAMRQRLYPVPGRGCSLAEAMAFEKRLAEATK